MPFSVVPKIPEIKEHIIEQGYTREFPVKALRIAIIRKTGLTSDKAIAKTIDIMKELNEIYQRGDIFVFRPNNVTPVMKEQGKPNINEKEEMEMINKITNAEPSKN